MKITVEINDTEELHQLVDRVTAPIHEANSLHNRNTRLEARVMELEDKLVDTRSEVYRLQQVAPTTKAYAKVMELGTAHRHGQKINCVKLIRELTGCGLKEAKDLYEGAFTMEPVGNPCQLYNEALAALPK